MDPSTIKDAWGAPSSRRRAEKNTPHKALINVLGVVYLHTKTEDGGDLYLTPFAVARHKFLEIKNWYEHKWFTKHRVRLLGTSSVYRVPTRRVDGERLDLVVKNCRVGEDVPLNTHTLQEFCNAEFNSPWEEFALVMEMAEKQHGQQNGRVRAQLPLAIYVPPQRMQLWQSGRSRSKINRIRARHPGIDIDILKQYKLIYEWIRGKNLSEIFEHIRMEMPDVVYHLQAMQKKAFDDLSRKGYLMADIKPEHVILDEEDCAQIEKLGKSRNNGAAARQVEMVYELLDQGKYSMIDYELLFRTPEHEDRVKCSRRHCYLDDMRDRLAPTPLPSHLTRADIFGVPYIFGRAESTGGRMWVVGRNARLFDYFLPERWRKTPSLSLSNTNEVFYTVTKDNIHLVWKTSRVGEIPDNKYNAEEIAKVKEYGINSPFEEFAISQSLNEQGIHSVYVRAVYMTGSGKVEQSIDRRKFESHKTILDSDGNPVLDAGHNYITIRGYYNGPDKWVSEHQDASLLTPVDLGRAVRKKIIDESQCRIYLEKAVQRLRAAGYDGSLLKANDLLLAVDSKEGIMKDESGEPDIIICNFEILWKVK